MKYVSLFFVICFSVLPGFVQAELHLIDYIDCVVCGPIENTPITRTSLDWKRNLENKFSTREQQIQTKVVSQQIVADKIPADPEGPKKYIEGIKKQNNFTDLDLENWFADVGLTLQEGLEALADQYNNEYFIHYKFKSQLIPTEDEILEYYEQNPDFVDGWYELKATHIDFDDNDKERVFEDVQKVLQSPDSQEYKNIWTEPMRILEDDVEGEKAFLRDMNIGEVKLKELDHAYELYYLLAHEPTKIRTLEQRRTSIVDILNRKKLEKMLENHNKAVREYVDVISFGSPDQDHIKSQKYVPEQKAKNQDDQESDFSSDEEL